VFRILDDNPTTDDRLGYSRAVSSMVDVIANAQPANMLPLTIGVFGGWGSGKTSVMKMAEELLAADGVKTVWFNAWKYDGKEAIWNALLQTIFYKMKADADAASAAEFRKRVVELAKALGRYSAKVATRLVPGGVIQERDVDAVLDSIASSADDELFGAMNTFETRFEELSREYVGDKGYMVVFIDDLDRCLPENAIAVLEALKLYLDSARCVFVVGVEPAVVEEAIRRRYANNPFLPATEYLEKIVQVPIMVPRVHTRALLSLGSEETSVLREDPQIEKLVRLATSRNPRRVKRFLNTYAIRSAGADSLTVDQRQVLVKTLLVQVCFPAFYRRLVISPGLFEALAKGDEPAWSKAGLEDLWADRQLRRFLTRTKEVCPSARDVLPWLRMEDSGLFGSGADGDFAEEPGR
jgi:KAP family P-loop domain